MLLSPKRIDLHCHSDASNKTAEAVLNALRCPESYSRPEEVYAQARLRGMDFVTLTDHDSIEGAVQISHKPDVLVTVINGAFRNLGPAEGAILARKLGVKAVIPCHHDLFADNCLPPQLLRTNLKLQGLGETYQPLSHGEPFDYLKQ